MAELKIFLESVSNTYDDFVVCVLLAVRHDEGYIQNVKKFIKEDSSRKSKDILEYLNELEI